jgi:hypothetical protein
VTVHTGRFGTHETFVPLQGPEFSGNRVTLADDKVQMKNASNVSEDGPLSPEEEQLYCFYGIAYGGDYGATGADYTGHAPGVGGGVGRRSTDADFALHRRADRRVRHGRSPHAQPHRWVRRIDTRRLVRTDVADSHCWGTALARPPRRHRQPRPRWEALR